MTTQENTTNIIGVKELRQNLDKYVLAVARGQSFTVVRRSKPIFSLQKPITYDEWGDPTGKWETIIDFRDIQSGGVPAQEVLEALHNLERQDEQDRKAARQTSTKTT